MKKTLYLLFVAVWLSNSAIAQLRPTGSDAMSKPEMLPFLYDNGVQTKQFITYDASGDNEDFSFNENWVKYIDSNGEYVIFDAVGKGCLFRQQMNAWGYIEYDGHDVNLNNMLGTQRSDATIKYYIDNQEKPSIDAHFDDFFTGKIKPYETPLLHFDDKNRFSISYHPIVFSKRLKITVVPNSSAFADAVHSVNNYKGFLKWFQYTYMMYPEDYDIREEKGLVETKKNSIVEHWSKLGQDPKNIKIDENVKQTYLLEKGKTITILDIEKEASISAMNINIEPFNKEIFYGVDVKVYWDENKEAAIDMPLSYLFGGGAHEYESLNDSIWRKTLTTLFYGFDGGKGSYYSYWPMPFWESAKIEITNKTKLDVRFHSEIQISYPKSYKYPKNKCAHFYAKNTSDSSNANEYYSSSFQETGRGHVVGIMFYSDKYNMDGDENTYIDDSRNPQMHGDGTEDDHNQAWGGGPAIFPLWGGLINGYQGSYRTYMNDSYVFNKNIKILHEYSNCCSRGVKEPGGKTNTTVFYYKSSKGANLVLTDEIDIGKSHSEELHQYKIEKESWFGRITSGYDGFEQNFDHAVYNDDGRAFKGYSEFVVRIDPANKGVKLRKRINRYNNGVQTAEIYVDGVKLETLWHIVTNSQIPKSSSQEFDAWFDADYEIPYSKTKMKNQITVKVKYLDYTNQGNSINEFYYWVFSYN